MKLASTGTLLAGLLLAVGVDPSALLSRGELKPAAMACTSSQPIRREETFEPKHWGMDLGVRVTSVGDTWTAKNVQPDMNLTGCLQFKDADGNPVGDPINIDLAPCEEISGTIPDDAETFDISDEPCPPDEKTKTITPKSGRGALEIPSSSSSLSPQQQTYQAVAIAPKPRKSHYTYYCAPIRIDPFTDTREFMIRVYTKNKGHAIATRNFIGTYGFSQQLPNFASVSHVEVVYYRETHANYNTMALEFTFANDDSITAINIDVNGTRNVLELANGQPVVTFNGWDAVKLSLPFSDPSLNYDATSGVQWENDYFGQISTSEPNEFAPTEISGSVTFESD